VDECKPLGEGAAPGAAGGTAMIRGLPKNWDEHAFAKWQGLPLVRF